MLGCDVTPDNDTLLQLFASFSKRGMDEDATFVRSLMALRRDLDDGTKRASMPAKLPEGYLAKQLKAPAAPRRHQSRMSDPLIRMWGVDANDSVAKLIESVSASKVCIVEWHSCVPTCLRFPLVYLCD